MSDNLKILHININSVNSKIKELKHLTTKNNYDLVLLNETKLDTDKTPPTIPNYQCYYKNRTANGGGVAIYIKSSLDAKEMNIKSTYETVALEIGEILIIAVYNPKVGGIKDNEIMQLINSHPRSIIIGDLNARHPLWGDTKSNANGRALAKISNRNELEVIAPDEPTCYLKKTSSIIDLAVTKKVNVNAIFTLDDLSTEHRPVEIHLGNIRNIHRLPEKEIYNYEKADWPTFKKSIVAEIHVNVNLNTSDEIDEAIDQITKTIQKAIKKSIPRSELKQNPLPADIRDKIRQRNKARRQVQRNPTKTNKMDYAHKKFILERALNSYNEEQWNKRILRDAKKHGNVWRLIKYRKGTNNTKIPNLKAEDGTIKFKGHDKAELLADTYVKHHEITENLSTPQTRNEVQQLVHEFNNREHLIPDEHQISFQEVQRTIRALKSLKAPGPDGIQNIIIKRLPRKAVVVLTKIYKACLNLKYFPKDWKVATIIPIKKVGKDSKDPHAYRPISLLNTLGKVLEKLILTRVQKLDDKIQEYQFGFRKNRSTVLQLASVVDEVIKEKIKKKATAMLALDIEKAYDSVWHKGLVAKLIQQSIPSYLIKIIEQFLANRKFHVSVNNTLSTERTIPAGVPQGSALSPTLFLLYLNDLPTRTDTNLRLFADDTAITAASKSQDLALKHLQNHIDELSDYYRRWKLKINPDKSNIIIFTNARLKPKEKIYYEDTPIPITNNLKYLGISLDKKLNFNNHVQEINTRARMAAYYIWPFITPKSPLQTITKIRLVKTYVRQSLIYGAPVWSSTATSNLNKLGVIENKCLRCILNKKPFEISNKELRKKTNWNSLSNTIYHTTKKFFEVKTQILDSTKNIANINHETHPYKLKTKLINQLLIDNDITQ